MTAQESPLSTQPQFTPDVRARLSEAAQNHTLAPWQREFMLEVARGATGACAADRPLALPGTAQPPANMATDDGTWIETGPPHSARTAIYDPVRDRMLVFGGVAAPANDVWALSLAGSPAWSALATAGTPPSERTGHTAIYDPVRDRMLVFGGAGGSYRNDVWALSLAGSPAWSALAPAGTPPYGRTGHTAIYDPVRDRMLVFGGNGGNDLWALSLAGSPVWSALAPAGTPPSGRWGHTAIYDPVRDRMVVFGGSYNSATLNDVWTLSLAGSPAWSELSPAGTRPSARWGHTAIYDPVRDRMLVFGGSNFSATFNDVWALSLAGSPAWSALAAGPPPSPRYFHAAIYDPVRDRMLVFGGIGGPPALTEYTDAWALSLASPAWSALIDAASLPRARVSHRAIYDPVRDRMLVFGGLSADPSGSCDFINLNDVWALSLAGSPAWSQLAPAGTPPPRLSSHTVIYDPVRDRMLVFGGIAADPYAPCDSFFFLTDVWALSLAGSPTWDMLAPSGTSPPPRSGHTAIYDPARDRMLVFGGGDAGSGLWLNDVWALSLAGSPAWSVLAPAGTPPYGRGGHTAIYDPVRDRMLVFGGNDSFFFLNDVWALSLTGSPAWTALAPVGTPPSGRWGHTAIYDPVRDRMLVFGGSDYFWLNDVWALSLTGSPAWSAVAPAGSPPGARNWHTAIYDPVRDRMVVFGGGGIGEYRNDLWALEWETPVSVPESSPANRFALAPPRPNPSFGRATLDFTMPQAAHVSVVIYDVAGRAVRKLVDEPLPAGQHSTVWDCRDQSGRAVPTGLYLVRVASPGVHLVGKVIVQGVL